MLKKYLTVFLLTLSFNAYAETIDIQCRYKPDSSTYFNRGITYFSIDLKTNGVTGGLSGDGLYNPGHTTADIFPDSITITTILKCDNHSNRECLADKFYINRIDGKFFGSSYDEKENEKSSIHGKCEQIKSVF